MDIHKLQVFMKVLEYKSLTKAAEYLGYTQSGITHIINGIENEIGFRLLKRSRTGISLTSEGQQIVGYFEKMISIDSEMNEEILKINGVAKGNIRIGSFTSVTLYYLPKILKVFLQDHPDVNVTLVKGNSQDIENSLDTGTIDIGYLSWQDYQHFDFIELMKDPVYAVMSPENPLAHFDPLPIDKLNGADMLHFVSPTGTDIDAEKIWAKIKPNVVYTTNFDYSLISMARQNLGVCLVPGLIADNDKEGVVLRELEPKCYRTVGIAVSELANVSPAVKALIECSKTVVKNELENQIR